VIALEPKRPFKKFYYRCDSKFHIDDIVDHFDERQWKYAVVIIEGEDAEFYRADQKLAYELLGTTHGVIQKRQGRGGQSKNRIARLREETIHVYVKKIVEYIDRLYIEDGQFMFDRLILSGATQKIRDVIGLLSIDRSVIKTFNYNNIEDLISQQSYHILYEDEKEIYKSIQNEINELLELKSDLLAFGEEIFEESSMIETIYISDTEYEIHKDKLQTLYGRSKTSIVINDAVGNFRMIGVKYFNAD
jgi:peptide chain release factor subunit 1